MNINFKLMGKRISEKRRNKKMTQENVAEIIHITPQHFSRIECGSDRPSLSALVDIANALECTLDDLLCDSVIADFPIIKKETNSILDKCNEEEMILMNDLLKYMHQFMLKAEKIRTNNTNDKECIPNVESNK